MVNRPSLRPCGGPGGTQPLLCPKNEGRTNVRERRAEGAPVDEDRLRSRGSDLIGLSAFFGCVVIAMWHCADVIERHLDRQD